MNPLLDVRLAGLSDSLLSSLTQLSDKLSYSGTGDDRDRTFAVVSVGELSR